VGIAVSDPFNIFAIPITTLDNNQLLIENIKKIIEEKSIGKIILGYPLKENGERSSSTDLIEKFLKVLKKSIDLEIELVDERYSSEIAKEQMIQSIASRKKRRDKKAVDMRAAAVILKDYLESGE